MSWQPATDPHLNETGGAAVPLVILPHLHDLGDGFSVRRVLPAMARRTVGPVVFLDHFGPTSFAPGTGLDVRPHPHIGLATVTYLLEGEVMHRDSLGSVQLISAGAVNWMTAGRGIAHSERTPADLRASGSRIHGIQLWIGLPKANEEAEPGFVHYPADALPEIVGDGHRLRLLIGSLLGHQSPVTSFSELIYADIDLPAGGRITVPDEHPERAVYIVDGVVECGGNRHEAGRMLVLAPDRAIEVTASAPARFILLGGTPLDGPRHLWWNFVSSSQERIATAKADWKAGRFASVIGETEFIPLPEG